jgi:hypothetical protein
MLEVAATDAFVAWYEKISVETALAVERAVAQLELQGSTHGQLVRDVGGEGDVRIHRLCVTQNGSPLRLCYVTDARGRSVLLLAGDTDEGYDLCHNFLASAEGLWRDYLQTTTNGQGGNGSARPWLSNR